MKRFCTCSIVLAVAGCGSSPGDTVDAGSVDVGTGTEPLRVRWERLGEDGPPPRPEPYLGTLNGTIVLFGGRSGINGFLDDTWIWDGSWTQLSPPTSPPPRANGVLVEQDGRLILVGGVGRDESDGLEVLGDVWSFDGTTWSPLPGTIPGRQGAAASLVGGHVVVVGGSDREVARRADAWSLAPTATTWTELPEEPRGRRDAAMTTIGADGYLTGGSVPGASADVVRFDGSEWTTVGELRVQRAYHAAGTLADRVVVFGGVITSTQPIGVTDGWPHGVMVVGDEPEPRMAPRMITLGDAVYMWGGRTMVGESSELWRLERAP